MSNNKALSLAQTLSKKKKYDSQLFLFRELVIVVTSIEELFNLEIQSSN